MPLMPPLSILPYVQNSRACLLTSLPARHSLSSGRGFQLLPCRGMAEVKDFQATFSFQPDAG